MKLCFICKASVSEGIGHLIRSITLANYLNKHHQNINIEFHLITNLNLSHKFQDKKYSHFIHHSEEFISTIKNGEIIILDMLTLALTNFNIIKDKFIKIISISPIFNHLGNCDLLITRTKYTGEESQLNIEMKAGLQFSIIRDDCERIDSGLFNSNLKRNSINIALSMGGTDPENDTLTFLNELNKLNHKAVFWVLLGEEYPHTYADLIESINATRHHEIILARTNRNMWHILSNCSLAILKGGLTSYEAAYAGLPAINIFKDKKKAFLVKELEENEICFPSCFSISSVVSQIEKYLSKKEILQKKHEKAKQYFTISPIKNVADVILSS